MINYKVPTDINKEAKTYMNDVLCKLDESGVLENVDNAALDMLARNYSMFINASKQVEKDGMMIENNRGNLVAHPMIKVAKDSQTMAMKVMAEFGLTAKARTKLPKLDKTETEATPLEAFVKQAKEIR